MKNLFRVLELENHIRKQLCSKKSNAKYMNNVHTNREIQLYYC